MMICVYNTDYMYKLVVLINHMLTEYIIGASIRLPTPLVSQYL